MAGAAVSVLVTGAAGFLGFHVSRAFLDRGDPVVGVDDLNAYYDPAFKRARIERLNERPGFRFLRLDVADADAMEGLARDCGPFRVVVHLAAQAGVRHAAKNPLAYGRANLLGQIAVFEACRRMDGLEHLVYASSSSVYGANAVPWAEADRAESPVSLYAATKRGGELIARAYCHLYGTPTTGIRFFTVYGPWGRPDMAAWLFTEAILAGRPIPLFGNGEMRRDFTYVDDVIAGVLRIADRPPPGAAGGVPHRIFNLGGARAEPLRRFVAVLERALGRKAEIRAAAHAAGRCAGDAGRRLGAGARVRGSSGDADRRGDSALRFLVPELPRGLNAPTAHRRTRRHSRRA